MLATIGQVPWMTWAVYAGSVVFLAFLLAALANQLPGRQPALVISASARPRLPQSPVEDWEPLVVLLMIPVFWFPTPTAMFAVAAFPVLWLAIRLSGGRWMPASPIRLPIAVMAAMIPVSLAVASIPVFTLTKVGGLILGLLVCIATLRWTRNLDRARGAILSLAAAGTVLAILGLVATQKSDKFADAGDPGLNTPIVHGIPGAERGLNPNAVAGVLVLFIPLQLVCLRAHVGRWLWPRHPRRAFFLAAVQASLSLATLVHTQSRGGLLALLVAMGVFHRWSRRFMVLAGAVGLVLLSMSPTTRQFAQTAVGPSGEYTIAIRVELWRRGITLVESHPLTGIGMDMFRKVMPPLPESFELGFDGKGAGHDPVHSHNQLIQAGLDLGIPGLVGYLALWVVCGERLRAVWRSGVPALRAIAAALAGGLAAHFLFGLTDAIALGSKAGLWFWLTVGVVAALPQALGIDDPRFSQPGSTSSLSSQ